MSARLINPTDLIEVKFVPVMIYGPPGLWKTSLAQTVLNPLTLDFDKGIHRCKNRRHAMQFDSWRDCIEAMHAGQFDQYKTLVIDTGGRALDSMIPQIIQESPKNSYMGNLSPQGWGILGNRFTVWLKTVAAMGKDLVMVCHQEEIKNTSGDPYFLPDLPGKMSYKEIHKSFDLIGRIRFDGKRRVLDFNPSDNSVGKNAAGWEPMEIPDLHQNPNFLADLITDAKRRIGKTAEAAAMAARQATVVTKEQWREIYGWVKRNHLDLKKILAHYQVARPGEIPAEHVRDCLQRAKDGFTGWRLEPNAVQVKEWQEFVTADPSVPELNARLPELGKFDAVTRQAIWDTILWPMTKNVGLLYDEEKDQFLFPEAEASNV